MLDVQPIVVLVLGCLPREVTQWPLLDDDDFGVGGQRGAGSLEGFLWVDNLSPLPASSDISPPD